MSSAGFKMQVASDAVRDGLGVELLDEAGDVIAEVFRSDREHTVILTTFGNDVPLDAVLRLINYALQRLDPFFDGTPLTTVVSASAVIARGGDA